MSAVWTVCLVLISLPKGLPGAGRNGPRLRASANARGTLWLATTRSAAAYGRRFIGAVEVEIDIVTGATEARGAGAWIAFTAKPKLAVSVDKLALNAIALPAM